jgi:hypothetical protein
MLTLPPPPVPAPLIARYQHPAAYRRPVVGGTYRHKPIHQGYREGRPSPVIRYSDPVQVYRNKKGRTYYGYSGEAPQSIPTRQFNQRYSSFEF